MPLHVRDRAVKGLAGQGWRKGGGVRGNASGSMLGTMLGTMCRHLVLLVVVLLLAGGMTRTSAQTADGLPEGLARGAGEYVYLDAPAKARITVYYYKPSGYTPDSRVFVVMSGDTRTAYAHRLEWKASAETYGFMLLVPCFSEEDFPGAHGYQYGNIAGDEPDAEGKYRATPRDLWTFSVVERLFQDFRMREASNRKRYTIYGHSAGAQFVHRMALCLPEASIECAISANAGWYLVPDFELDWPFGLKGIEHIVGLPQIAHYLQMPLLIALGDQDLYNTNRLNTSPLAMRQGEHRYARGMFYFEYCKKLAETLGIPFGWRLLSVPGVGHSNGAMAQAAAAWLAAQP